MKKRQQIPPFPTASYGETPGRAGDAVTYLPAGLLVPLWIATVSRFHCTAGWECTHDNPSQYFLEIPLAGELHVCVGEEEFDVRSGEVALLPPGIPNRLAVSGGFCRKLAAGVCGTLSGLLMMELLGNEHHFTPSEPERLEESIRRLWELLEEKNLARVPDICAESMRLLLLLRGDVRQGYPSQLTVAIRFPEFNFNKPLRLNDVAAALRVPAHRLTRLFLDHLGATPHEYLTGFRLNYAGQMLSGTRLPVKEVAYQSGYSSPAVFSREFRKAKGCTPSQFRAVARIAGNP